MSTSGTSSTPPTTPRPRHLAPSLAGAALALLAALLLTPAAGATLVPDGPRVDVGSLGAGYTTAQLGELADQSPRAVMDATGSYIVFWWQAEEDPARPTLVARKFEADGTPEWVTRPFYDSFHDIGTVDGMDDLAGNADGDFVLGWISAGGSVQARVFDVCGVPLAGVVDVGVGTAPDGHVVVGAKHMAVGVSDDDTLIVAFIQVLESEDDPDGGTFERVVARRLSYAGDLLGEQVDGATAGVIHSLDLAVSPDGHFVLTSYQDGATEPFVVSESFDAGGERLGTPPPATTHAAEVLPRAAIDSQNHEMVALQGAGGDDGDCTGIFGRFAVEGTRPSAEVQVNEVGAGCQTAPRVDDLAQGWVTAWRGGDAADDVDGADHGIQVRAFAQDGTAEGGQVRVLPGFAGGFDLAAGGDRAVVAAILAATPHEAPRVVVQRLAKPAAVACTGGEEVMCVHGGRFRVEADWRNPYEPFGTGLAFTRNIPDVADSDAFWFFRDTNLELMVKVLDGLGVNGYWWVFYGSLSTVEFWVTVTDNASGEQKVYYNPPEQQASVADNAAFPGPGIGGDGATVAPGASLASFDRRGIRDLAGNGARSGVIAVPAAELTGEARVASGLSPPLCVTTEDQLCLRDAFAIKVDWKTDVEEGVGHTIPLTRDTGAFWFFNENNAELMIKVLDGRALNGHWWVFYAGLSDVEYTITVDPFVGEPVVYSNEPGELRSRADVTAIDEEDGP